MKIIHVNERNSIPSIYQPPNTHLPNIFVKLYVYLQNNTILLQGSYNNVCQYMYNNKYTIKNANVYCIMYLYNNNTFIMCRPVIFNLHITKVDYQLYKIKDIHNIRNGVNTINTKLIPFISDYNYTKINLEEIPSCKNYILLSTKMVMTKKKFEFRHNIIKTYRKLPRQPLKILKQLD